MQSNKQIIEIVQYFENGGGVMVGGAGGGVLERPQWSFPITHYTPFNYNFKVGDLVEIVYRDEKALPIEVGKKVQIDRIDQVGDIWDKEIRLLFDASDINFSIIKPAKAPEPEYVPFTNETFPRGLVFIKHETWGKDYSLVTSVSNAVRFGDGHIAAYGDLLKDGWLISLDGCETWGIAGVLK